jgi:hypothetical protein
MARKGWAAAGTENQEALADLIRMTKNRRRQEFSTMIRNMAFHKMSGSRGDNPPRIRFAAMVAIIPGLSSCANRDIVRVRRPSPDGKVEALLVERETGATVATPMLLYIVKAGDTAPTGEPVLLGDNFEDLSIKWVEAKLLSVTYRKGRIFKFTNFWESSAVDNWSYVVEIRLDPINPRSLK